MSTDTLRLGTREFRRLHELATTQGWSTPNPDEDNNGPEAWASYWRALESRLNARRATSRPIPPYTPGGHWPEDHCERAVRINHNRDLWRGYLT